MGEKTEVVKWSALGIAICLVVVGITYVLRPLDKAVERQVLLNSHQYEEGMADREATLRASLAEIDSRLINGVDEETRKGLEAQRSTINVQLAAIRRK